MKYKKAKTGISGLTDFQVNQLAIDVKTGCLDNSYFSTIVPLYDTFVTKYEAFLAATPARQLRNQVSSAFKREKREELDMAMIRYAHAVMSVAYGNNAAIESSGYKMTAADKAHRPKPGVPTNVDAVIGVEPNTIYVTCDSNADAALYEVQIHSGEGVLLGSAANTTPKVLVTGILAGVTVFVKMQMKNAAGAGDYSKSITTRIPLPNEPRVKFMSNA